MVHIPILRAGRPYRSLDTCELAHVASGEPVARVSRANPGLIAHDLNMAPVNRRNLASRTVADLLDLCGFAAKLFSEAELPVDPVDGVMQTPDDYVRMQSATTGLPQSLCRANMEKNRYVLAEMETVLSGLTRGLDLSVLDTGSVNQGGSTVSYVAETDALGAVLPSNSPGVHSLWLPAIPLKVPLVLKPGQQEPWTPTRIAQAFLEAGCPPEAFSLYPTSYGGAAEILMRCGRSMMFGNEATVRPWRDHGGVQSHGPGWSKVLLDAAAAESWRDHLELIVTSIAENGGRSCVNASGVWVAAHGREIAEALAEKLAAIEARPLEDPEARLAAFSNPQMAHKISEFIDRQLAIEGAEDVTLRYRPEGRVVEVGGCTFVLPTVIWCEDPGHPLATTELLFPFASVVEVPADTMLDRIGPTLVATGITDEPGFTAKLMDCRQIDRLNLGGFPTTRVAWDQPHEGNLFEHLYRRRSLQSADPRRASA